MSAVIYAGVDLSTEIMSTGISGDWTLQSVGFAMSAWLDDRSRCVPGDTTMKPCIVVASEGRSATVTGFTPLVRNGANRLAGWKELPPQMFPVLATRAER
jgi:hypothetical protein